MLARNDLTPADILQASKSFLKPVSQKIDALTAQWEKENEHLAEKLTEAHKKRLVWAEGGLVQSVAEDVVHEIRGDKDDGESSEKTAPQYLEYKEGALVVESGLPDWSRSETEVTICNFLCMHGIFTDRSTGSPTVCNHSVALASRSVLLLSAASWIGAC